MRRKNIGNERGGADLEGKPVSASRSEMTEIVLPAQTNPLGKLLGGHVMHLVDMAAAMAAHRHSGSYVVTASVDYIDFRKPKPVPPLIVNTEEERRRFEEAGERREVRLALRYGKKELH